MKSLIPGAEFAEQVPILGRRYCLAPCVSRDCAERSSHSG
jgi:hypothetical protein